MVRCLTMGLSAFGLVRAEAEGVVVAALDPTNPQLNDTAAIPATNDAVKPPAVARADLLFICTSGLEYRSDRPNGQDERTVERYKGRATRG
jgi:hypothetical protein